jgi:predicted nucleic acid-binding protein
MPRYGVDTSAVLAWILREPVARVAEFWDNLNEEDEVVGARLLLAECTSVIRVSVFDGRITQAEAVDFVAELVSLPIRTCQSQLQFTRALELAERFRHRRAYDMQHLAAAEVEAAELVTLDGGLRYAALELRHPVRFLG